MTVAMASRSIILSPSWIDDIQILDQLIAVFVVVSIG
jgi:hypothetical protein